jgi:hypothetical protein
MRRAKEQQELFNFSFVDILATTIGVLIFIMVMVILNSANRVTADDVKDKTQQTAQENEGLKEKLGKIKNAIKDERKTGGKLTKAMSEGIASFAVIDRNVQEKQKEKLTGQKKDIEKRIKELEGVAAAKQGELDAVRADTARPKVPPREPIVFRVPEERETDKEPIAFECDGDNVYIMVSQGNFNKRNYTANNFGPLLMITRNENAIGESFKQASRADSEFRKTLDSCDKNKHYALFIVRQNGFSLFRKVREILWAQGWESTWEAMKDGAPIVVPTSGGGGKGSVM